MFNFLFCAEEGNNTTTIIMWVVIIAMIVLLFVFNHFSSKKRKKAEQEKLNSLSVGDKVLTGCGIIGTIVRLDEISPVDMNMVIETGEGENKSTLTFDVRALYQVLESAKKDEPEIDDAFDVSESDAQTVATEAGDESSENAETVEDNVDDSKKQ